MTDEAAVKVKPEVETVTMTDGRLVEFPGKKRLQKETSVDADGNTHVRLDFRNGTTIDFQLPANLIQKFAAHGASQKLGDEVAGLKKTDGSAADIEDQILAVEELIERLNAGEWTVAKESGGMAGTSVLLRAIVQVTGKSVDSVKGYLKTKTQAQKIALRDSAKFRDAVAAIEAEKKAKAPKVTLTDADLAEIDALPA